MKKTFRSKAIMPTLAFAAILLVGLSACNGTKKTTDSKDVAKEQNEAKFDNSSNEKDAKFIVNAAEINLEEIKLGQLAQQKGMIEDIKGLGKTMEAQHTETLTDLTALAKQKVISIPTSPTENGMEAYKELNDKEPKYFDRAYCDKMVKAHKEAITLFEKASTECNDAEIKAWAVATLPHMRMHLDSALACQMKLEKM